MEYNIINTYIKFIKTKLIDFFRIVLRNRYQKSIVELFVDKYIEVRYFNETNYYEQKDFIKRLNNDLIDVYSANVDEKNSNTLKTIVALFGYLTYLDDLCYIKEDLEVIKTLSLDKNLKIDDAQNLEQELKTWYYSLKASKEKFQKSIGTKEFSLTEKRIYKNTFEVKLEHNVKISYLFSETAINKAYNSGTVNEDKLFITYILTTFNVLNNANNLDFSKKYIVDIAESIFSKEKKRERLFNILNTTLAKKHVSIKINYSDYLEHKEFINKKIKEGYSFSVVLDKDDADLNELILFSYVYVYEDSELFDIISNNENKVSAKIIKI